jgi:hypothetical protein
MKDRFYKEIENIAKSIADDPFILKGVKQYIKLTAYYIKNEEPVILARTYSKYKKSMLIFTHIIKTHTVFTKCDDLLEAKPDELTSELLDYTYKMYKTDSNKIYYIISVALFMYVQNSIKTGKYENDVELNALRTMEAIIID